MVVFSLSPLSLSNLRFVVSKIDMYREHRCLIVINDMFNIEMPVVVAAVLSKSITNLLENDPTLQTFKFTLNTLNDNNKEAVDKIKRVLVGENEVGVDDEEMKVFADFGQVFGNYDFVSPLNNKLKADSESLSADNVVDVLNMKKIFEIDDIEKELSFIAQNFDSVSSNEQFISFSRNSENINTIEQIITSNSLQMNNEDVLLLFLLSICENNEEIEKFIPLFGNLFLEYCSASLCQEFISFVSEIAQTHNMRTLINCIGRRLTQPNIPIKPDVIEGRHTTKETNDHGEIAINSNEPIGPPSKVVIIGDGNVGKTSILNRFCSNEFNNNELATIGGGFRRITKTINGKKFKFELWDTPGNEQFKPLARIFYRNAIGVIAVFSLTDKKSYENIKGWLEMFTDIAGEGTVISIIGNKSDLTDSIEVDVNEVIEKCNEKQYLFAEVSAKSRVGIDDFFNDFQQRLFNKLTQEKK
jgi:small GTP-binding protein